MKKGVHGEEGQEDCEDCAAKIVLVGRPDNGIEVSCKNGPEVLEWTR